jgi:hypothetical protein
VCARKTANLGQALETSETKGFTTARVFGKAKGSRYFRDMAGKVILSLSHQRYFERMGKFPADLPPISLSSYQERPLFSKLL